MLEGAPLSGKKATFSIRPFDKLDKQIERTIAATTPPPVRKKKKEEYTDEELFSSEMTGVQEIAEFRALALSARSRKYSAPRAPLDPEQEAMTVLGEIADGQRPIPLADTQEYVEWVHPDHIDTIIPCLHEGRFSVQSYLDLHGFTVPEAEQELDLFLHECFQKRFGCVKIIHGRGLRSVKGARLKSVVVKRLIGRFRRQVVAFVMARQCDGGLGALYVLLRNK